MPLMKVTIRNRHILVLRSEFYPFALLSFVIGMGVINLLHCVVVRYQSADLVKLDILLNGQPVDAMATIIHNLKAQRVGRLLVEKLKQAIDRFIIVCYIDDIGCLEFLALSLLISML